MPFKNTHAHKHRFHIEQVRGAFASVTTLAFLVLAIFAAPAFAETAGSPGGGGTGFAPTPATNPGLRASISADGRNAIAPAGAPLEVQKAIWAANQINRKPYVYGGGHRRWRDRGYDCSSTVSYALHGGGLLDSPLDSSSFMKWGEAGAGAWITVYANPGHAYAVIAGLRLDTSGRGERGPRWRAEQRSTKGYRVRHPLGF